MMLLQSMSMMEKDQYRHLANFEHFPSDCAWKEWGSWGLCTVTCGDGTLQRYRGIDNPAVEDGKPCEGPNMQSQPCTADCVGKFIIPVFVLKIFY